MKKTISIFLGLALLFSCSSDDDTTIDNGGDNIDNGDTENGDTDNGDTDNGDTVDLEAVYNETADGDLSDDNSAPTPITFAVGDNIIIADQVSGNADYFTFEVPQEYELSQINVDAFDVDDVAFIGIASGTSIDGFEAENLLGGLVYGQANIDTNILSAISNLPDAIGFVGALPSGEYTVWLNQTGNLSNTILSFVLTMAEEEVEETNNAHNEATDGDLSDDSSAPTPVTFAQGDNIIIADQVSGNADYFTFEVPQGYELSEINVDAFDVDDVAFIGINSGTSIGATAADLLGGLVYGQANIGTNILPAIGTLSGATGFTGALPTGTYTVWLNQTVGPSTTTLNFVLSIP